MFGRALRYGWSEAGRLTRIDYPDRSFRSFSHDRAGRMVGEEASDQSAITYQRDRVGRLLGAVLNEDGQRVETLFERDALGRVVTERQGDRAVRFGYDAHGRRSLRVMPDGATTRYAYDAADALTRVEHNGSTLMIERDALGREIQRSHGEGRLTIQSGYDAVDRLIEQRATAPSPGEGVPVVLVQRQWEYDRSGRVKRIDDARWGATAYRHDALGQLLSAARGAHREVFAYDGAGSLTAALAGLDVPSARGSEGAWTIAPGNLLSQTATAKYAYDVRGRRTGQIDRAKKSTTREGITEYRWDCRDRLREVELPSGDRVKLTYDAFGRRVKKEVLSGESGRARVIEFVWDGDALAADIDSERGARGFVHAPGTLIPLLQQERAEVLAYVNDHLGMPKELLDSAGRVAWAAAYSAWGKVVETHADPQSELNRGRKVSSPFRLLGQYADEETGLCCTRFRYFDPEVGRWCSPDPLGIEGGKNLFGFDGSPTNEVDPLGLSTGNPHGPPPPNLSPPGAGRAGAFNEAKRRSGIPTSQQPTSVKQNIDRRGNVQPGRQYNFDVPAPGGGTRTVGIRDDAGGHFFGPNNPQNRGSHFNDDEGNHYDY